MRLLCVLSLNCEKILCYSHASWDLGSVATVCAGR